MNEETVAIQGIWAAMNSWFTPTILFVVLNVVIGTIAVTSGLATQKYPKQNQNHQRQERNNNHDVDLNNQQQKQNNHHQHHRNEQLNRSPSVLERLKSINFYTCSYRSQEPISIHTPEGKTHVLENRFNNIEPVEQIHQHREEEQEVKISGEEKSMEEIYSQLQGNSSSHHNRTKSEIEPASGEIPIKLAKKMRKSASVKSPFSHFEEVETRRPATVKEAKVSVAEVHDDEEVDAKADDFINKFKQQLKLQRLDSIVRYKEMLSRGSGK